jgi:hypothetical protein
MSLNKSAADTPATAASAEFSDRDILVAIPQAVCALSARLGGGKLVVGLHSEKTGRRVDVHASPDGAGFVASVPLDAMPVRAALSSDG